MSFTNTFAEINTKPSVCVVFLFRNLLLWTYTIYYYPVNRRCSLFAEVILQCLKLAFRLFTEGKLMPDAGRYLGHRRTQPVSWSNTTSRTSYCNRAVSVERARHHCTIAVPTNLQFPGCSPGAQRCTL